MQGPGEGGLAPIFWNYAGSRVTQRILILKKDRPKTLCKIEVNANLMVGGGKDGTSAVGGKIGVKYLF